MGDAISGYSLIPQVGRKNNEQQSEMLSELQTIGSFTAHLTLTSDR